MIQWMWKAEVLLFDRLQIITCIAGGVRKEIITIAVGFTPHHKSLYTPLGVYNGLFEAYPHMRTKFGANIPSRQRAARAIRKIAEEIQYTFWRFG